MAFSRYFVVPVLAVVLVLAVQFGAPNLNRFGRCCAVAEIDPQDAADAGTG